MKCKICDKRPPRRYCPGVQGDICSICCGNEREVTITCPLTCPYLIDARKHERYLPVDNLSKQELLRSEEFLLSHEALTVFIAYALNRAIVKTADVVDADVRDALDGLTRTYRTLDAGLYHESRPVNPYAAKIFDRVQEEIADFRAKEVGSKRVRDSEILRALVLQQRLAQSYMNGRRKGRAYIHVMQNQFEGFEEEAKVDSALIVL